VARGLTKAEKNEVENAVLLAIMQGHVRYRAIVQAARPLITFPAIRGWHFEQALQRLRKRGTLVYEGKGQEERGHWVLTP